MSPNILLSVHNRLLLLMQSNNGIIAQWKVSWDSVLSGLLLPKDITTVSSSRRLRQTGVPKCLIKPQRSGTAIVASAAQPRPTLLQIKPSQKLHGWGLLTHLNNRRSGCYMLNACPRDWGGRCARVVALAAGHLDQPTPARYQTEEMSFWREQHQHPVHEPASFLGYPQGGGAGARSAVEITTKQAVQQVWPTPSSLGGGRSTEMISFWLKDPNKAGEAFLFCPELCPLSIKKSSP